jgi:acyl-CoA thioesterase FadM
MGSLTGSTFGCLHSHYRNKKRFIIQFVGEYNARERKNFSNLAQIPTSKSIIQGDYMQRQFGYTHTVRYDECNCDGELTPTAFLRYMQDIAARDAKDAQLEGNGYWVVKRTIISFATPPIPVHMQLALKTYGIGFTRITAQRGYEARIANGANDEPVISARTLWVYVDPRGRPARLPERTAEIWLPDGPQPQRAEAPFPISPESTPETTTAVVRFSAIDQMRHLNNASAVEILDNAAWEVYARSGITPDTTKFTALHYDIEYIDSPRFGDNLTIQNWLEILPANGQEFTRHQQIVREGKVMVHAYSRWLWKAEEQSE